MTQIYLGLGTNVDRERHLTAGLDALSALIGELECSAVFESEPVGIRSGPFYNMVVMGFTDLPLAELSLQLKHIEANNGRYAPDRKGLPLDIDVLLYGDCTGDFNGLVLPRAEILRNAFVLWPLSMLAPDRIHPVVAKTYGALWREGGIIQSLRPVDFTWNGRPLTPTSMLTDSAPDT